MKISDAGIILLDKILVFGEKHRNLPVLGSFLCELFCYRAIGIADRSIKKRNYARAINLLERVEKLALKDSCAFSAKFQLARLFWNGWGVEMDRKKAVILLEAAASGGHWAAIDFMTRRNQYLRAEYSDQDMELVA